MADKVVSQNISSIYSMKFIPSISIVLEGLSPVITAEWMNPGSCHPKSLAELGSAELVNLKVENLKG